MSKVYLVLLIVLAGCRSAARKATPTQNAPAVPTMTEAAAALNAWYRAEPDCLWFHSVRIPVTYPDPQAPQPDDYHALLAAKLIYVTGSNPPGDLRKGTHIDLTPMARASWHQDGQNPRTGNLCFGSPEIQRVESIKPFHDPTFGDVAEVQYMAKLQHPAAWTSANSLRNGFPKMFLQLNQALPGSASLKWNDGAWQIAAGPADSVPADAEVPVDMRSRRIWPSIDDGSAHQRSESD